MSASAEMPLHRRNQRLGPRLTRRVEIDMAVKAGSAIDPLFRLPVRQIDPDRLDLAILVVGMDAIVTPAEAGLLVPPNGVVISPSP